MDNSSDLDLYDGVQDNADDSQALSKSNAPSKVKLENGSDQRKPRMKDEDGTPDRDSGQEKERGSKRAKDHVSRDDVDKDRIKSEDKRQFIDGR